VHVYVVWFVKGGGGGGGLMRVGTGPGLRGREWCSPGVGGNMGTCRKGTGSTMEARCKDIQGNGSTMEAGCKDIHFSPLPLISHTSWMSEGGSTAVKFLPDVLSQNLRPFWSALMTLPDA